MSKFDNINQKDIIKNIINNSIIIYTDTVAISSF
jgi:hypothetical protein